MTMVDMLAMPAMYMVRADDGRYTQQFLDGHYVGIGFLEGVNLASISSREEAHEIYVRHHPKASVMSVAQNVGQIWRFVSELRVGVYVVTRSTDASHLHVGRVTGEYVYAPDAKDSRYPHRKPVEWLKTVVPRSSLSVPLQRSLNSSLTLFQVRQPEEIFEQLGVPIPAQKQRVRMSEEELKRAILDEILNLQPDEFELLVRDLLEALDFESSEQVGKPGDGGIDVVGKLRVYQFAEVDVMVQVKRYASGTINHNTIKDFRSSVPEKVHATFVTTSTFTKKAREEAERPGFKTIGLIDGPAFVDILIDHYDDLSEEMREKLNLRKTLMPR